MFGINVPEVLPAPDSLDLEIIEIGGLPLYNQDLEDNPPAVWTEFRQRLKKFDGVLFATPEYNVFESVFWRGYWSSKGVHYENV